MEWVSGNCFIRENRLGPPGTDAACVSGHTHNFDHTTIVFTGAIRVKATLPDGRQVTRDFHAPAHCLIRKDVTHEIAALEDGTVFWCVYCHHDPQGRIHQEYTGWDEAYV